jgi:hypothetical protein
MKISKAKEIYASRHRLELEVALWQYKKSRIFNGDNLEDIIDDIEDIVSTQTNKWLDEDPIDLTHNEK